MSEPKARPKRIHPIALSMKAVGYLTSPETLPGKAFTTSEKLLTQALDRLGRSDAYLDLAGKVMKAGFVARRETTSAAEAWLQLLRLPTAGDVSALRKELRAVRDEVEALGAQLEVVVSALEKREPAKELPPPSPSPSLTDVVNSTGTASEPLEAQAVINREQGRGGAP